MLGFVGYFKMSKVEYSKVLSNHIKIWFLKKGLWYKNIGNKTLRIGKIQHCHALQIDTIKIPAGFLFAGIIVTIFIYSLLLKLEIK
jgi:hypothetical protein